MPICATMSALPWWFVVLARPRKLRATGCQNRIGKCCGPQIWAMVSFPLFNIYFYVHLIPRTVTLSRLHPFVDNTDLIVTMDNPNPQEVMHKMQQSLSMWNRLLWATSRALVPNKCFWYFIGFQWSQSNWSYQTVEKFPVHLQIPDDNRNTVILLLLEASEARQTLGVCLTLLIGNNEAEFEHLHEVTSTWHQKMATSLWPCEVVDFKLIQVLIPKLKYPLIATTFTTQQCHEIIKLVLQQGQPAIGANHHFPCDITHSPRKFQGLAIPELHMNNWSTTSTPLAMLQSRSTRHQWMPDTCKLWSHPTVSWTVWPLVHIPHWHCVLSYGLLNLESYQIPCHHWQLMTSFWEPGYDANVGNGILEFVFILATYYHSNRYGFSHQSVGLWSVSSLMIPSDSTTSQYRACLMDSWLKQCWILCWQLNINTAMSICDLPLTCQWDLEIIKLLSSGFCGNELVSSTSAGCIPKPLSY